MRSLDDDIAKDVVQMLEDILDSADKVSAAVLHLLDEEKTAKQLSWATLNHYERELQELAREREQLRGVIARWWTLLESAAH